MSKFLQQKPPFHAFKYRFFFFFPQESHEFFRMSLFMVSNTDFFVFSVTSQVFLECPFFFFCLTFFVLSTHPSLALISNTGYKRFVSLRLSRPYSPLTFQLSWRAYCSPCSTDVSKHFEKPVPLCALLHVCYRKKNTNHIFCKSSCKTRVASCSKLDKYCCTLAYSIFCWKLCS